MVIIVKVFNITILTSFSFINEWHGTINQVSQLLRLSKTISLIHGQGTNRFIKKSFGIKNTEINQILPEKK